MIRNVLVLFVSVVLLASCSQQRFGHLSKVKVNQQANNDRPQKQKSVEKNTQSGDFAVQHEAEKAPIAMEQPVQATTNEISAPEQKNAVTATAPLSKREVRKEVKETMRAMKKMYRDLPTGQAFGKTEVQQQMKAPASVEKSERSAYEGRDWLRLIIIGLVLTLIGILIPGPVGTIFYIVGGIIIIVGLIFLLLELV